MVPGNGVNAGLSELCVGTSPRGLIDEAGHHLLEAAVQLHESLHRVAVVTDIVRRDGAGSGTGSCAVEGSRRARNRRLLAS